MRRNRGTSWPASRPALNGSASPPRSSLRTSGSATIVDQPLIDPDHDEVSRLILDTLDEGAFRPLRSLTVGEFREYLVDDTTGNEELRHIRWAVTPEVAAAVAKLMSNKDLVLAAGKVRNVTRCRNTMGQRGRPRHPRAAEPPGGRPRRHPAGRR